MKVFIVYNHREPKSFNGALTEAALIVAATDWRVKCVVSVVPTISGHENTLRVLTTEGYATFVREVNEERARRQRGEELQMKLISKEGDESYEWSKVAGASTTYVSACMLLSRAFRDAYEPGQLYRRYFTHTIAAGGGDARHQMPGRPSI